MGRGARIGFGVGVAIIVGATVIAAVWLFRPDYRVLFSDLTPQDAGAMTAELERMKVPYKLGVDGVSILVEAEAVHRTRLKLMAKDLPLHGTVGFELFNNADFGMTEFAQKINYQRALQGEITRTILSLAEIETARVHLALPEDGLFKRADSKAKASITLAVKRGQTLRTEQVSGIQRLVSAAVPAIQSQDVTIVDQHGVALTRAQGSEGESASGSRLDLKKETEAYMAGKAIAVLERAFGAGQSTVSVDVNLNMDQVKTTTEDVIGAAAREAGGLTGVVVRERQTIHDGNGGAPGARAGDSQKEVDYQVGRRVQQVVSAPGGVTRIHVVAVVRKALNAEQMEQARAMVLEAVGGVHERGDSVVLQTSGDAAAVPLAAAETGDVTLSSASVPVPAEVTPARVDGWRAWGVVPVLLLLLAMSIGAAIGIALRRRGPRLRPLTEAERLAALAQVNAWLHRPAVSAERERSGAWTN
jgi:flagellar M-ring protein FliF